MILYVAQCAVASGNLLDEGRGPCFFAIARTDVGEAE